MSGIITRRTLITSATLGAAGLLTGCDKLGQSERFRKILFMGESMNFHFQRALSSRSALAPEFSEADISPFFRGNGSQNPSSPAYVAHAASNFANWRIAVEGLVDRPLSLSLADLRSMPQKRQITMHNCVEGWTAIGGWTGVPLATVLDAAGARNTARYVVFRCADQIGGVDYYEVIDMIDARHPQTILAHMLNHKPITVQNGAPVRLRVERQLGYKQAKYIQAIQLVPDLSRVGQGKGGYWEDRIDYEWYAGI